MDRHRAERIDQLDGDQITELHLHMVQIEECIQTGAGSPYDPPGV
jgi:hypothetical protein